MAEWMPGTDECGARGEEKWRRYRKARGSSRLGSRRSKGTSWESKEQVERKGCRAVKKNYTDARQTFAVPDVVIL
eukprot:3716006-Pleurochrysis_carterae.AAC.1